MKKLFTYSFSVWLSICVLLASVGVPVFAHSCSMENSCKEISVLPAESCCSESEHAEIPDNNCVKEESCCIDEMTIFKAELPAVIKFSTKYSIIPQVFSAVLPAGNILQFSTADIHFKIPPQDAPPIPAGRSLLSIVHILRI